MWHEAASIPFRDERRGLLWTGLHFDPTHRGTYLRAVSIVSDTVLNFYAYFVCGCCIELFGVSKPVSVFSDV